MLSTTAQYAIRAMVALAQLPEGERGCAVCVAEQTGAPANYLSKLLKQLAHAGLLHSQKGQGGGFSLARPAREISLWQVVETVDRLDWTASCLLGHPGCSSDAPCTAHWQWQAVRDNFRIFLVSTSIGDLAKRHPSAASIMQELQPVHGGVRGRG